MGAARVGSVAVEDEQRDAAADDAEPRTVLLHGPAEAPSPAPPLLAPDDGELHLLLLDRLLPLRRSRAGSVAGWRRARKGLRETGVLDSGQPPPKKSCRPGLRKRSIWIPAS